MKQIIAALMNQLSRRNARKQGSKNLPNPYNRCGKNTVFSLDSRYAYRLKPNPYKVQFQIKEGTYEGLRCSDWEATDKRVCPLIIIAQHKTINVKNEIVKCTFGILEDLIKRNKKREKIIDTIKRKKEKI